MPLSAPTFDSIVTNLLSSDLTQGEIAYLRSQAALMCDGFDSYGTGADFDKRLPPGSPARISGDATFQFYRTFCGGSTTHWSVEANQMNAAPSTDPLAAVQETAMMAYEGAQGDLPKAELDAALTMLESEMWKGDGASAFVAAEALASLGHVSTLTSEFVKAQGISLAPGEAAEAQFLAAKMAACRNLGGCGPGELFSMIQCRQRNVCTVGATARDAWSRSYSPSVLSAAEKLDAWNRHQASQGR